MDLMVQDVHDFVNAINDARTHAGLEPLDKIAFDSCQPNDGYACLSATHLFGEFGAYVSSYTAETNSEDVAKTLASALGGVKARRTPYSFRNWAVPIPEAILKVTNVYDSASEYGDEDKALAPLRALFVEAGYVE